MENKRGKHIIKKSEMSSDVTYILCPDSECDIFFDENKSCIHDCPNPEKARQIDYCDFCKNFYENEINYSVWKRKDHLHNSHGVEGVGSKFCNEKWELIHEYPKDE